MSTKMMRTTLNDIDIEVEVHYDAWGATCGYNVSPDEDAGCEVERILWYTVDVKKNPVVMDITELVDCDKLEEDLMESFADDDGRDE